MRLKGLLILAFPAVGFALKTYEFNERSTAVIKHFGEAFTQGLTIDLLSTDHLPGRSLTKCSNKMENSKRTVACYLKVLNGSVALFESSGLYGQSFVRRIRDLEHGLPDLVVHLRPNEFAEGLDFLNDNLLAVATWKEKRLLLYNVTQDVLSFHQEVVVKEPAEHWGLASNRRDKMWMTDGSPTLYEFNLPLEYDKSNSGSMIRVLEPPARKLLLKCDRRLLHGVNELDYNFERGTIWGNMWMKNLIVEIDPTTGDCLGLLDLDSDSRLRGQVGDVDPNKVWNGLVSLGDDWLLFTGKYFNYIYISRIRPVAS